jgi:hypothetical protein
MFNNGMASDAICTGYKCNLRRVHIWEELGCIMETNSKKEKWFVVRRSYLRDHAWLYMPGSRISVPSPVMQVCRSISAFT